MSIEIIEHTMQRLSDDPESLELAANMYMALRKAIACHLLEAPLFYVAAGHKAYYLNYKRFPKALLAKNINLFEIFDWYSAKLHADTSMKIRSMLLRSFFESAGSLGLVRHEKDYWLKCFLFDKHTACQIMLMMQPELFSGQGFKFLGTKADKNGDECIFLFEVAGIMEYSINLKTLKVSN